MEARPPAEIQKHYLPRGPLQLSRFATARPFLCVRCGVTKTAKLAATYDGTWQHVPVQRLLWPAARPRVALSEEASPPLRFAGK